MYDQFKVIAERIGADVHRFPSKKEAIEALRGLCDKEKVEDKAGSLAVWAACPVLDQGVQEEFAKIPGVKLTATREDAAAALIGISQVDWALADTGSLVQYASAVDKRIVSMLPEIHVAFLPTEKILPDMPSWIEKNDPAALDGYMAVISGPSRTADIERVLTIGVHGPRRLVIYCVDNLTGGAA